MDTVEKYIHRLPDGQFEFAEYVRGLILNAHPEMEERLVFGSPFFVCRQWLCYLNFKDDKMLEIGFCKGNQLTDKHQVLIANKRKVVRSLEYGSIADFNEDIFMELLQEAVSINLTKKKTKSRKPS